MTKLNQQFKLPDGRLLGYDEYGAADGQPLMYLHGSPSCRLEWLLFGGEPLARALNLRVVIPDRPGLGLSDFQPNRRIGDWPKDAAALADHLGWERFAVLGYSGGGPYALACAAAIPGRLARVGVVSGAGPFDKPGLADGISPDSRRFMDLAHGRPWLSLLMLRIMGLMARFAADKVVANALAALPAPDREAMANPEAQQGFLNMIREAMRHGPRGAQLDTQLMVSPWDFQPQAITLPVQLWHGEADQNAPVAMGRYVAEAVPHCRAEFHPGEGHLSLMIKNAEAILRRLTDEA